MSNNNTLVLDFEKNIVEIEAKIESLKLLAKDQDEMIALRKRLTARFRKEDAEGKGAKDKEKKGVA